MQKIFQEDVDAQCDIMRGAGVPIRAITGSAVWRNLGGVGSRTTAYDLVRNWKARLNDRSAVAALVFSDTARQQIVAICERVASVELDTERQATAVENAALQDELNVVRGERDDLVQAVGELEAVNMGQAETLGAVREDLAEAKAALTTALLEVKLLTADRARLLTGFADRAMSPLGELVADDAQTDLFDGDSGRGKEAHQS